MKSLFNKERAAAFARQYPALPEDLALRVYTSRLIGADKNLVLHGGGNTSVKLKQHNILGEEEELLYVKGSGVDLSGIRPDQFVGLFTAPLKKLRRLDSISDEQMDLQLKIHRSSHFSLNPSVEALLHAFLPHKFIDHTHADSILILSHQKNGPDLMQQVLGPKIAVLPYVASGLCLAQAALGAFEARPEIEAIVISSHGIFTFDRDGRRAYEKMIHYVAKAEAYIRKKNRKRAVLTPRTGLMPPEDPKSVAACFAQMVRGMCAGSLSDDRFRRFYVEFRTGAELVRASLAQEAEAICRSGVLTPDHVIRTKNKIVHIESLPQTEAALKALVGRKINAFQRDYRRYFNSQIRSSGIRPKAMDPLPRLFLVAGLGLFALGFTAREACIAADIGEQTLKAKLSALGLGSYLPISDDHLFDMEYWQLQQQKLDRSVPGLLQGQVALVTGGGGAIGCGVADRLLASGAAVAIGDKDASRLKKVHRVLAKKYGPGRVQGVVFDVTRYAAVEKAYEDVSCRFGGIDILVPNAGIAHVARLEELDPAKLDQVLAVNLSGTFTVIKAAIPVFKRQATGGNIILISSKNVFDPGAAFGAYSASKAGAHQIAKIAALELAEYGIRVNMVNPDAVFGDHRISSTLWDLVGPERMKSRGLDAAGLQDYYRQRSLLKTRVLAEHVGNAVVFFASNQTPTTGASLPVDGGIPAAFPR
ncbi:MAG: bifunctional aldolase/short-chain dehydrogenase [Desulfobacterales bacterium]|nr:bifunctional aldolase/short-chain dehydrogenase [Desulfobacterales bacterium]